MVEELTRKHNTLMEENTQWHELYRSETTVHHTSMDNLTRLLQAGHGQDDRGRKHVCTYPFPLLLVYKGDHFHTRPHHTKLWSGHTQRITPSPSPPPSTTTPSDNVQTAAMHTAKKPKVITAEKPRREDLLRTLRMAEQGLQNCETQATELRTVKKPIMQQPA
ncbi:hypothetical protein FIBSPDRAFT_905649 [Athelia psychrophila]|uniref:Uncharacterized protein n=1 Tax=Athelia psychrophila TaxID=1759441 RepID=A0A167T7Z1_9AGAM|nr:hypothetical protein FIBSPDRAFT_905649 [Fibularhizoctonia sp. CBS 109695]